MNRAKVMEQIAPVANLRIRDITHSPRTRVTATRELAVIRPGDGGRTLDVTSEGVRGLARFIGVPLTLADDISPSTFSLVINELLTQKMHYSLLLSEGRVVDFTKPVEHRDISPERVMKTIEGVIGSADYHRVMAFGNTIHLEVLGDRQEAVAKGDLVQAGTAVEFSPLGITHPLVQSYALRLVCTNGVTTMDSFNEFSYTGGEGDDVYQWFRQSVRKAYGSMNNIVKNWQKMRNRRIRAGDRAMFLEGMIRQARFTREVADAVRAQALEEPPQNEYDMLNLITYASSHFLTEPEQVRRAQSVAAEFATESGHRRVCPVCRHTR